MSVIRRLVYISAVIIPILAFSSAVWAEEEAGEESNPERFMLRVGGYNIMDSTNLVRVDSNHIVGAYIDFEETLGGDTTATVFRLDSRFRFTESHALAFSWYNIKFEGTKSIDKSFTWDGETYSIGAELDSKIEFDIYKLNYQYSLFHNDKAELGILAGFHVMKTAIALTRNNTGDTEASDITAPLPVVGFYADYNFFRDLSAYYNYQLFLINYDDTIKGSMQDFILGLEYRAFDNVALGAALNKYSLAMKFKDTDKTKYLDSNWSGVMLYGTLYF